MIIIKGLTIESIQTMGEYDTILAVSPGLLQKISKRAMIAHYTLDYNDYS